MHVGINHDYFTKGLLDYQNWHWAWGRELLQNGVDAGASHVTFDVHYDGEYTIAKCSNNAPPMSRDVLINKFLSIGGTTKSAGGSSVGGFGIAKTVIALAHHQYSIRTGEFEVKGFGGEFELLEGLERLNGTETTVVMTGDQSSELSKQIKRLCYFAQLSVDVTLNGEILSCDSNKGSRRRELSFGTVYSSKRASNVLVVRIGGLPMFTSYIGLDRLVTVELSGNSSASLTSNRDGLKHSYRDELSSFITSLAVDSKSALRNPVTTYTYYSGNSLSNVTGLDIQRLLKSVDKMDQEPAEATESTAAPLRSTQANDGHSEQQEVFSSQAVIGSEFVLKNETSLGIPLYYCPESVEFSDYSRKLAKIWARVMLQMHKVFDRSDRFTVGFLFSEDDEAQHEVSDRYGRVYYLSPAMIVEQSDSRSRSFKKRFKLTDRNRILMIALHEFIHGGGFGYHDENYACCLTNDAAKLMNNRKSFNWCFAE